MRTRRINAFCLGTTYLMHAVLGQRKYIKIEKKKQYYSCFFPKIFSYRLWIGDFFASFRTRSSFSPTMAPLSGFQSSTPGKVPDSKGGTDFAVFGFRPHLEGSVLSDLAKRSAGDNCSNCLESFFLPQRVVFPLLTLLMQAESLQPHQA